MGPFNDNNYDSSVEIAKKDALEFRQDLIIRNIY